MDKNETNRYALKITNKSVDREVFIYRKLYNNEYNIEKVHQYALVFLHPPGKIISSINLLNNLIIIWDQLKPGHRNNIVHCDIRKSNIIEIFHNHQAKSSDILIIDWRSASEVGFDQEYCGTLSTASKYILDRFIYKRNENILCLPIDDCISFMKVVLLEILPKEIKEKVLAKVKQGSYSGINLVYEQIYKIYANEQSIILRVIQFLEKHRSILNNETLISYMDHCLKRRLLFTST
ncbi:hypothetical protein I4U23_009034 [Adineta vaga]|nr:hypothetical protein I4U23_009034 [Adineta vaga]